ncbi:hypothetical protein Y013_23955 [Rhodococcus pyridinivorans SB3094]|uniref:Uncharacterized protein n=1 Tax=Rhodococcus pyridinivorans SB3094 TaxID=1435356 RepID=V9XPH4_9NOCA|nr:hypothetical protein Y013_23955 [Rhodococcus pyridinivorans SB3094]
MPELIGTLEEGSGKRWLLQRPDFNEAKKFEHRDQGFRVHDVEK